MISRQAAKTAKTNILLSTTTGTLTLGCPEGATFSRHSPRKSVESYRGRLAETVAHDGYGPPSHRQWISNEELYVLT